MKISAMNSGAAPHLEPPTIERVIHSTAISPTTIRPNRFVSDWRISVLVLIGLWAVIYMAGLSRPPLLDDADTVHAEAAREMLLQHDWVTLHTNGIRYLEKAPLMLGVLGLLLATYKLGRYVFGESGGLYAGVVLATSVGPYIFTRILIPDILIGLWLTIGYYFFLRSLEEEWPSRLACWGFAATCALNVLTKGLIGLVFPAGAI